MTSSEEKIIELSKTKITLLIFGSVAFIALGLWLSSLDSVAIESSRRFNNPTFVHGIGWLSVVFGVLCGIFGIKKLFDKKPGLVFNATGIIDNSSGICAGLIPWNEISGFDIYEVHKQKMLVILLKNPDKYIEMGNAIKRNLNKVNFKLCGSPIVITSSTLKVNFDGLLKISNEYLAKYGSSA